MLASEFNLRNATEHDLPAIVAIYNATIPSRMVTADLDPVTVEAYGSRVPLNQVANMTVPEARMLSVSVWDKSMVGAVERAIRESNLGLNPIIDGQNLRSIGKI